MATPARVVPSLLIVPAFVALVASFQAIVPTGKKPIALLALAFAAVYAATVGTNYFLLVAVNFKDGFGGCSQLYSSLVCSASLPESWG